MDLENQKSFHIATAPPSLPRELKLGDTVTYWQEVEPGLAEISSRGGPFQLRLFSYQIIKEELEAIGFRIALPVIPPIPKESFTKKSTWNDVMNAAVNIMNSGRVHLLRNGYNVIVAQVEGDHGKTYQVEVNRQDPNSRAISSYSCECPWGSTFAWDRSRQFKRFEGRPCKHCLATVWQSSKTPLDEDIHPATQYNQNPQQSMPMDQGGAPSQGMPGAQPPMGQPPVTYPQTYPNPQAPGAPQGPVPQLMPGLGFPPITPDTGVIPPQLDPNQLQLVPPSAFGPQQPTPNSYTKPYFSARIMISQSDFQAGDVVRLNSPVLGQSEGREGAYDVGQWMEVPQNTQGEVVDVDQTTNWISAIFPLSGGAMSSYHVRVYLEPSQIGLVQGQPRPTPFTQRRSPFA